MSTSSADEDVVLSIGEVLELLQLEFPDVTISKIRFLESQGLIQPGRTASGYRRFNHVDVERLQWILHQQRDNFLPLKVIRQMLDDGVDRFVDAVPSQPTLWARQDIDADLDDDAEPDVGPDVVATTDPVGGTDPDATRFAPDAPGGERAPEPRRRRRPLETPADVVAALQEDPRPRRSAPPRRAPLWEGRPEVDQPTMTGDELCRTAGISPDLLADLERFGLVRVAQRAGEKFYGPAALEVATIAARAAGHGLSARHLRTYLVSAEREAGFIEQLTLPLLKQRNPGARQAAVDLSAELAGLGAELHAALLRRELGPVLGDGS